MESNCLSVISNLKIGIIKISKCYYHKLKNKNLSDYRIKIRTIQNHLKWIWLLLILMLHLNLIILGILIHLKMLIIKIRINWVLFNPESNQLMIILPFNCNFLQDQIIKNWFNNLSLQLGKEKLTINLICLSKLLI